MKNRRGEDAVLVEKIAADFVLIDSFDLHVGDGAGLQRIERGIEAYLRQVFQAVHPVTRKLPEACFLALAANAVMKQQCFANGQLGRG